MLFDCVVLLEWKGDVERRATRGGDGAFVARVRRFGNVNLMFDVCECDILVCVMIVISVLVLNVVLWMWLDLSRRVASSSSLFVVSRDVNVFECVIVCCGCVYFVGCCVVGVCVEYFGCGVEVIVWRFVCVFCF